MKAFFQGFLRKDLSLDVKWWHRFAKVLFFLATLCFVVITSVVFFGMEESRATRYQIVKTLQSYYDDARKNAGSEIDLTAGIVPNKKIEGLPKGAVVVPIDPYAAYGGHAVGSGSTSESSFASLGGELMVTESFMNDKNLSGILGCLKDDGSVEWLSEDFAKELVDCKVSKASSHCYVPQSVCGGKASSVVRYNSYVDYSVGNYSRVATEALLTTLLWIALCLSIYYRGAIYIIFGSQEKPTRVTNA